MSSDDTPETPSLDSLEQITLHLFEAGGAKARYVPKTREQKFGYLIEEAGEVLHAQGKIMRWGWESVNPTLPPEEQETNRDWLLREMRQLHAAVLIMGHELGVDLRYCPDGEHCYKHEHGFEHPCCACDKPGIPLPSHLCVQCHQELDACECDEDDDSAPSEDGA